MTKEINSPHPVSRVPTIAPPAAPPPLPPSELTIAPPVAPPPPPPEPTMAPPAPPLPEYVGIMQEVISALDKFMEQASNESFLFDLHVNDALPDDDKAVPAWVMKQLIPEIKACDMDKYMQELFGFQIDLVKTTYVNAIRPCITKVALDDLERKLVAQIRNNKGTPDLVSLLSLDVTEEEATELINRLLVKEVGFAPESAYLAVTIDEVVEIQAKCQQELDKLHVQSMGTIAAAVTPDSVLRVSAAAADYSDTSEDGENQVITTQQQQPVSTKAMGIFNDKRANAMLEAAAAQGEASQQAGYDSDYDSDEDRWSLDSTNSV